VTSCRRFVSGLIRDRDTGSLCVRCGCRCGLVPESASPCAPGITRGASTPARWCTFNRTSLPTRQKLFTRADATVLKTSTSVALAIRMHGSVYYTFLESIDIILSVVLLFIHARPPAVTRALFVFVQ
jgi:hypothetical protein